MKRIIGALALVIALLAVSEPASAAGHGAGPLTGTIMGSASFVPEEDCVPVGLETQSTGSGIVTRLGRVEMSAAHCTPAGPDIAGRMILTAANGDELYLDYGGTCDALPPDAVPGVTEIGCDNPFVVAGGTGRFEDATGTGHLSASVTFMGFGAPEWPAIWELSGSLRT